MAFDHPHYQKLIPNHLQDLAKNLVCNKLPGGWVPDSQQVGQQYTELPWAISDPNGNLYDEQKLYYQVA